MAKLTADELIDQFKELTLLELSDFRRSQRHTPVPPSLLVS